MAKVFLILLIVFQICIMSFEARPQSRCPACPTGGCVAPSNCNHGIIVDNCGRHHCAKGPGEACKIKRYRMDSEFPNGNCGDGMYCHCGVCMGCSLDTFTCFEATCVFAMPTR